LWCNNVNRRDARLRGVVELISFIREMKRSAHAKTTTHQKLGAIFLE
jgi:hypothetical protein